MIEQLRPYQKAAITMVYEWLGEHAGNPCIVAPTGAGKSWIIAGLCEDILKRWPESRILVLSHVKELLTQDAEKILAAWSDAPLGIYSAGLKSKELNTITVAGIQSIHRHGERLGKVDLVIVDEAHLINNQSKGMYRSLLGKLLEINPAMRVIGLTATPYRLGQGLITEGEGALFQELIEPVTLSELITQGYLAPLSSKVTKQQYDLTGVKQRGGEYVEKDLQAAVDTKGGNASIVKEVIARASGRKSWLFFCSGVKHAINIRDELRKAGVTAEVVTGETPPAERDRIIQKFRKGKITALTNANVLTTGTDCPEIDLIALCRPTLSPGLYMQMAGRGMRPKRDGGDCLVLDFAGNVTRHGPVTLVTPPSVTEKKGGKRPCPTKICPQCGEILALQTRKCTYCGADLGGDKDKAEGVGLFLREGVDIMGINSPVQKMETKGWRWIVTKSKSTGKPMLRVDYLPKEKRDKKISEYVCICHGGRAAIKAGATLEELSKKSGRPLESKQWRDNPFDALWWIADALNQAPYQPAAVEYIIDPAGFPKFLAIAWQ